MESQYFIFDGVKSHDMRLHIVRVDQSGGFVETPYWGGASVNEEFSRNRIAPYFYGIERDTIEFTLEFTLLDDYMQPKKWTSRDRYEIARWLLHDEYKEFQISDDLGKFYNIICIDPANLNLINSSGYVELTFKNASPYALSPVYIDHFNIIGTQTIEIENQSNVLKYYNPKIEFVTSSNTSEVALRNLSNGGKEMTFSNLLGNETISIDTENKIIKSDKRGRNPFADFNVGKERYWMDLVYGINQIEVTGNIELFIKSQFPIAQ